MCMRAVLLGGAAIVLVPSIAMAGEEVIYEPAPDWAIPAEINDELISDGPAQILYDWQHRLEEGIVHQYSDSVVRIDNPQQLMEEGTLTFDWMPDKGDLYVHRIEILRDGKTIDLIADGAEFDVLRREQGLEQRLLDGQLTATLAVPGLQLGDVLRVTHSITVSDQALGKEVQATQYLFTDEWEVGTARAIMSWKDGADIRWDVEDAVKVAAPELRDGWRYLTVELPLPQGEEMPLDAPSRYQRLNILRAGSFADWQELSRVMAPHFDGAAQLAEGSTVADEAERIMRETADPLARTALAVRLVQDEVSYLLDGLDGGNYLPQTAEETWEKRYGDCKAKSVLLLALLRHMGIEAETAVVVSSGGDALPELLPIPADFDHIIVRAKIAGTDYWLDGTSSGTRLENIGNVPPFFHALPLRSEGADLEPMVQRVPQQPNVAFEFEADHSAGVDLPYLFGMKMTLYGPQGAQMRAAIESGNRDMLRSFASTMADDRYGLRISAVDMKYDEEAAAATLSVEGVGNSSFEWQDGRVVLSEGGVDEDLGFNPDRARPAWRNIPVATPGPMRTLIHSVTILPEDGRGFSAEGQNEIDASFANTKVVSEVHLEGNRLAARVDTVQMLGEIAPADVPAAKLAVRRLKSNDFRLVAPEDVTWRWDLDEEERATRAKPILAAYDAAIDFAEESDYSALVAKAAFLKDIYDFDGARAAFDELIEHSPSAWAHFQRASVLESLGRPDEAIADLEAAYALEPDNGTAFYLARLLGYGGRMDEARELLEQLPVGEADRIGYADAQAMLAGLTGEKASGLDLLAGEVAETPQNSDILNSACWYRGLFNVALEEAVEQCTRAVERAADAAPALDSRAMVRFRLGQLDEAIADLDEALALAPSLAASRYLRGVIRLEKGDNAGRRDIETALRMAPELAAFYSRHGVAPRP